MLLKKVLTVLCILSTLYLQAQFSNKQRDRVDVIHYGFYVHISNNSDSMDAKAEVKLRVLQSIDSFFLNFKNKNNIGKGMHITSVKMDGKTFAAYKHQNDILVFNKKCQANDTVQVEISYSGIPEDGLYIGNSMYGEKTYFGDNWPNRAQYWLPVIDHPSDKALVDFYIRAPEKWAVIASGTLQKKQIQQGEIFYHYKTQVPLATKVMVFGAANFKVKQLDTVSGIPVSSWIYKASPDAAFEDYRPAVEIIRYYSGLLGKFPYGKLANVQSKTRFGGMENAGNIFYYEESANGKHQVEALVAHEVAHQWFGNAVSEKEWRDIWLSEGFATYLTDLFLEHKYGAKKLKERMLMEKEKVLNYYHKTLPHPIVYDEKDNLFALLNRNSYEKGAWVLHMLRHKLGDAVFYKILKQFYNTYKHKNAHTEDFIRIAQEISGKDLSTFFQQWLYRNDIPKLEITKNISRGKLKIGIVQLTDKAYHLHIPIAVKSPYKTLQYNLSIHDLQHEFVIDLPENSDYKVQIDPEVTVLFE